MKEKSVNGWISLELHFQLEAHCKRLGLSKSTFIRTIILDRIKDNYFVLGGGDTGVFDCAITAWIDEDSKAILKANVDNISGWLRESIYDELNS